MIRSTTIVKAVIDRVAKPIATLNRSLQRLTLALLVLLLSSVLMQSAQAEDALTAVPPAIHGSEHHSTIQTPQQVLLYLNAQNLVDTWNNIIIQAKTGDEQLKLMRESGVFADDVKLTFDFGDQKLKLTNLYDDNARSFYNGFVNGLKKNRYNIASNVEAVEFGADSLRFNFKHWIFFNDQLSLVGENQAVMKQSGDRYFITSADLRVIYLNVAHAY